MSKFKCLKLISLLLMLMTMTRLANAEKKLRVCTTVPELGSLVKEIAGDKVSLVVFAKGTEDPHFVDAKPSFIKELSQADLFIEIGMELEIGWAPVLVDNARNGKVLPGGNGFLDVSRAITPLEVPKGVIDRLMGDVHPAGNPHYLLDPVNGIKVARLITERLIALEPAEKSAFEKGFEQFRKKVAVGLAGAKLAEKYDIEKLALLDERGKLDGFLRGQNESTLLEGWWGDMKPYAGSKVIVDHNMWPYFAERFHLEIAGSLEPKPGIQPTTKHLGELIKGMKTENISVVLTSSYYDPRHARFVGEKTGAKILLMAHQVGSRPGTDDYLSMIAYNVKQLQDALAALGKREG